MGGIRLSLKRFVDVNVNIRNSGNGHEEKHTCKDNYFHIYSPSAELLQGYVHNMLDLSVLVQFHTGQVINTLFDYEEK